MRHARLFTVIAFTSVSIAVNPVAIMARAAARSVRPNIEPTAITLDPDAIRNPELTDPVGPRSRGSAVVRAAILLDRAHFSSGEIDGYYGKNLQRAIAAYQAAHGLEASGEVDAPTWAALNEDKGDVLVPYTIVAEDLAGPFEKIPSDMVKKAKLSALNYESPIEGMAETFHSSPKLLAALNPGKDFTKKGEQIIGPNVMAPFFAKAATVVVDKSNSSVTALDDAGKVLVFYPATIGSVHDPLPIGKWKITGVKRNPWFFYNSKLFWDAEKHAKAKIRPGPNNPVGVVWIALSIDHYGIHGTPEPSKIGHTTSHGCIRLTNWDASELAALVSPGTPAILKE
jgi:lipoprotein-anchoring transpeptidase ErfK/SrfK